MSELIGCTDGMSAKDITRAIAKTANGAPFYLQTQSGSFSPADLPNLILWLKASVGVTVATGVSVWEDQSPSGNNMVQPTGSLQPALLLNEVNGHPTIQGDGNDDWLDFTSNPIIGDFSIFAVIRGTGYWIGSDFSGVHYINHTIATDTFRSSIISGFASANDPANHVLSEFHRTGTAINGFENTVASASNPLVNGTAWQPRALCRRTTTYSTTKMAEIIICSAELSAENKTATQEYLLSEYALP